jgi:CheY-like chemotaxis protein
MTECKDGAPGSASERNNRYLLVVDSKSQELLSISLLLQRFEYRVCSANTAGQALEMVSGAVPALVLADLVLPGMSGMDLFNLLRQDPSTASVPVVFLIPAGDRASERRCREAGAAGWISKPIQTEDLYRTVQAAIEPTPRANIRIRTRLAVSVNNMPLDSIEVGCASVLSEHGMYVQMPKPYPINERLFVQIKINNRTVFAEASVLYRHAYGEGPFNEPGMGIKFIAVAPEDQEFIRQFIREEVTKGIKPE